MVEFFNPHNIVHNWKVILMVLGQPKYAIDIDAQPLLTMYWPGLRIQSFQMLNHLEKKLSKTNQLTIV